MRPKQKVTNSATAGATIVGTTDAPVVAPDEGGGAGAEAPWPLAATAMLEITARKTATLITIVLDAIILNLNAR